MYNRFNSISIFYFIFCMCNLVLIIFAVLYILRNLFKSLALWITFDRQYWIIIICWTLAFTQFALDSPRLTNTNTPAGILSPRLLSPELLQIKVARESRGEFQSRKDSACYMIFRFVKCFQAYNLWEFRIF